MRDDAFHPALGVSLSNKLSEHDPLQVKSSVLNAIADSAHSRMTGTQSVRYFLDTFGLVFVFCRIFRGSPRVPPIWTMSLAMEMDRRKCLTV